jgi:hypothetical protein
VASKWLTGRPAANDGGARGGAPPPRRPAGRWRMWGAPGPLRLGRGLLVPAAGGVASGYLSVPSSVMLSRIVRAVTSTRVAVFLTVSTSPSVHPAM